MNCAEPFWTVERLQGSVSALLTAPEPKPEVARLARVHTVTTPGLVLGSTQKLNIVDPARAAVAGVEVLRRRSGGGSVLLWPGLQVWVDLFITPSDPLWSDDVGLAAGWIGKLWKAALLPCLSENEPELVSLHTGRAQADRWGRLVCFAGRGPGEVLVGEHKVVGVSQRRSRNRARFQTTARIGAWSSEPSESKLNESKLSEVDLLDLTEADRESGQAVVAARCGNVAADAEAVTESLLSALAKF